MAVCEYCGKRFNPSDAAEEYEWDFDDSSFFPYENIKKTLCAKRAAQAIEDHDDGVYYETCEECGKTFDYFDAASHFDSLVDGISILDAGNGSILCFECAMEAYERIPCLNSDEESDDLDDGSDEGLSVYDAAEIWASHGKDEDYTFGYSEEELEDALKG